MSTRFTIDGSDRLEASLSSLCETIREEVRKIVPPDKLQGNLLGGGYGRGEGGVLRTPSGDLPYNDLEFYVLVRGIPFLNERRYGHALHELGEQLSPHAGLEVEFKVLSRQKLERSPVSMFYYDLVVGHKLIDGPADLLAGCEHHRDASKIPLHEATRLLMNRCSGLLYSQVRLEKETFSGDDGDFVGRNLAKAQLAFGDVVLTAFGQYHQSCRERATRLNAMPGKDLPWLSDTQRHHVAGVEFKLHPKRSEASREDLRALHTELKELGGKLWLWLESRRLGQTFATAADYARSPLDKCPETPAWRNRLVRLKSVGIGAALGSSGKRYPRQDLYHQLVTLLWVPHSLAPAEFAGQVQSYEALWKKFN